MIEKYKSITFKILAIIPLFAFVLFIDLYLLPRKKVNDIIVSRTENIIKHKGRFSSSSSEIMSCYKFLTKQELEFSTENYFIEENEVKIEYSYIFKSVTSVKSLTKDYSDNLISGLKGLILILFISLLVTTLISLLTLKFYKKLSENGFLNIILMNSFLFLILLYFWHFQN